MKRTALILISVLTGLSAVFIIRGYRQPYREYIAPQDYIGRLQIIVDPASPVDIDTTELFRYHYVIRFPADGVLRVNNAWGVHPMAREEWKYPDGTLLHYRRVIALNGGGPHKKPGAEYWWRILPEGVTTSR